MEDEWGEREFVSDVSGDEDGLSDLEDVVVCLPLAGPVFRGSFGALGRRVGR